MNSEGHDIEQFEKHYRNQLTAEEAREFEERMKTDAVFAEQYNLFRSSIEALRLEALNEETRAFLKTKRRSSKLVRIVSISIAAMLVAGVGISYLIRDSPNEENLFAKYYEPYPNVFISRANTSFDEKLQSALEQYEAGNYNSFVELTEDLQMSDTLRFFRGISLISSNKAELALGEFSFISTESILYQQSLWYQSLAYLKLQQLDSAGYYLKRLDPQGPRKEEIRNLLKQLDR